MTFRLNYGLVIVHIHFIPFHSIPCYFETISHFSSEMVRLFSDRILFLYIFFFIAVTAVLLPVLFAGACLPLQTLTCIFCCWILKKFFKSVSESVSQSFNGLSFWKIFLLFFLTFCILYCLRHDINFKNKMCMHVQHNVHVLYDFYFFYCFMCCAIQLKIDSRREIKS